MKTEENNDVIDYTSVVYAENDIKQLWPIRLGAIFDKN